jgi:hypothetical protein
MMSTNKRTFYWIVLILLVFSVSACSRGRLRQTTGEESPTISNPTQPDLPTLNPAPTMETKSTVSIPTQPVAPTMKPEANQVVNPTSPVDMSQDFKDLDTLMNELDQILGSTETDIKVP